MLPQEKTAVVSRGLLEAFGVTEFEDICMTKGIAGLTHGRSDGRERTCSLLVSATPSYRKLYPFGLSF